MLQFHSNSIHSDDLSAIAVGVTQSSRNATVHPIDPRMPKWFPDSWVRLRRFLRTDRLAGGQIWTDTAADIPVIMLGIQPAVGRPSQVFLRQALRRLVTWSEKHHCGPIGLAALSQRGAHSHWENLSRQIAYQQLADTDRVFRMLPGEGDWAPIHQTNELGIPSNLPTAVVP